MSGIIEKILKDENIKWYVIKVQGGKEFFFQKKLEQELELKCFKDRINFLIPTKEKFHRKNKIYHRVKRPMFNGYVFFVTEDKYIYQEVESLAYINGLYCKVLKDEFGNPAYLFKEEVVFLQKVLNQELNVDVTFGIRENQRIRVIKGPFAEFESKIVKIKKRKLEIIVAVDFLGEKRLIALPLNFIEKI